MHELSLATAIVDQVRAELRADDETVTAIRVRIGALAAVVPEAMCLAFDVATADTALAGAALEMDTVPARARCDICADVFDVGTPPLLWCPHCAAPASTLVSGRELQIVEVRVAEPGDEDPPWGRSRSPQPSEGAL